MGKEAERGGKRRGEGGRGERIERIWSLTVTYDAQPHLRCTTPLTMHNPTYDAQPHLRCTTPFTMHNPTYDAQPHLRCITPTHDAQPTYDAHPHLRCTTPLTMHGEVGSGVNNTHGVFDLATVPAPVVKVGVPDDQGGLVVPEKGVILEAGWQLLRVLEPEGGRGGGVVG